MSWFSRMVKGRGKELLLIILILAAVSVGYRNIFFAFFQQDEWYGYSDYILQRSNNLFELISRLFAPSVTHFSPLNLAVLYGLFSFGMNYQLFAAVSLFLHLTSVCLVFWLAKIIFRDIKLAFFAGALFGVSASAYQGTSWVAADIGTHGATIFALTSTIFLFKYLNLQKVRYLYFSLVLLIASLLFKEIAVGLFVLFPLIFFLFSISTWKEKINFGKVFLVGIFIYFLLRSFILLSPKTTYSPNVFQSQKPATIIYNLVTVPFKAVSQSIFSEDVIRIFSDNIIPFFGKIVTGEKGTTSYESFLVHRLMEGISLAISLFLIAISAYIVCKRRGESLIKVMVLGLIWIIINSLIFAFTPERTGIIAILDSRYLYFVSIGTSFFVISLLYLIFNKNKFSFIIFVALVILNFFGLDKKLSFLVAQGETRKEILTLIKTNYPKLPSKVIFLTESDSTFYGQIPSERIMPFQSGFGQTLLIWYQKDENFPVGFFKNRFLWEMKDQGYKEMEGRGFGYFRDFGKLEEAVENENLPFESVISFRYDSDSQILTDNSREVRGRLEGYFSAKRKIEPAYITVFAGQNPKKAGFMLDGKRDTFWNSLLPYAKPQFLEISLTNPRKIGAISIDSYNDKDQNEVGYAIYLSGDGKTWDEVFYSKRYPPGKDGIVNLYFKPKLSRFVKIEQKGYHKYANWKIAELAIYETTN